MKHPVKYLSIAMILTVSAVIFCLYLNSITTQKTLHTLPALLQDRNYSALQKIGAQFIGPYTYPVAISLNGQLLLVKTKNINSFALTVYKKAHAVAKIILKYSPWEITWDPSGKCIAFLIETDTPGQFQLALWWINTNEKICLSAPLTCNASFPLKWSSDGQQLAFTALDKGRSQIIVAEINNRRITIKQVISSVNPSGGYAWSADSKSLVFCTSDATPSVRVCDFAKNEAPDLLVLKQAEVRDLNWSPSSQFIIGAIRLAQEQFFRLFTISLTNKYHIYPAENGDVKTPVWSNDHNLLTYILEKDSKDSLWLRCGSLAPQLIHSLQAGSIRIQNDGYKHIEQPIIEANAYGASSLFTIKNQSLSPVALESENNLSKNEHIDLIWLKSNHHAIPIWQRKNSTHSSNDKAIIFLNRGPRLDETANWDPLRESFVQKGFTVLAINCLGSSRSAEKFEQVDTLDVEAQDLIASVHYLEFSEKIKRNNITILASSYGTRVLVQALQQDPDLCGMIVFDSTSVLNNTEPKNDTLNYNGTVLVFHGARDPLAAPDTILPYLRHLFFQADQAGKLYCRIFDNEGHGFNQIASLQEICGTIMCASDTAKGSN